MADDTPPKSFVLLHGLTQRTGTNYLAHLIERHPRCQSIGDRGIGEDYLLMHSDRLVEFCHRVATLSPKAWDLERAPIASLERCLGEGMLEFLSQGLEAPVVVSRVPSVRHVDRFDRFYGQRAKVIVLLRDGRSVV